MTSSNHKGKAYERYIARLLRTRGLNAERQSQFCVGQKQGSDVVAGSWAIECKHVQTLNLKAALEQVREAATATGRTYAVVFRWSARGRPTFPEGQDFICLRLCDAWALFQDNQER